MKRRLAMIVVAMTVGSISAIPTQADARHRNDPKAKVRVCACSDTTTLSARRKVATQRAHHRRYAGRGGLICGATQMHHYGKTDPDLRLARKWAEKFPHTSAHPGAVVVQARNGRDSAGHAGGHVSRIVAITGSCRATVADERGTYERDICSRLIAYVDPNGSQAYSADSFKPAYQPRKKQRYARREEYARHVMRHDEYPRDFAARG